ncbi:COX15/CtaA family protein [Phycicoccus duodecadis]|uniref:Cytochrome c oxidase assembly protein subunit 15 n=1 Tax=Phycicoccus duodecadis TaxID=173053 RepID=A0A2N3YEI6_9MICO|nr:COX15/CtaA family protein [Phycicoccus duodecadis]PKW25257.1 cytochrome c oxidase assembly protein subunit 15 [Phycicoccus duodecadis]
MSQLSILPRAVSTRTVRRWAWATLVANVVIILTGGLVRLTSSGLGCPTWPRCTSGSFVPHRELGVHGLIEFGNRLLTYVLIAVVLATVVAVWRWTSSTRPVRRLAVLIALGVPFQGVVGGITVLTRLNPWVVALHLVLSMALVGLSVLLLVRVHDEPVTAVAPWVRGAAVGVLALAAVVVYLGTVVTGSGPHAGDANAPRNGLDPALWSHVHAAVVYALVALTVVVTWVARGTSLLRPAAVLLGVELAQGAVGFAQYFTGLPVPLVALHLVGAAALVASATWLFLVARPARVAGSPAARRAEPAEAPAQR